MFYAGAILCSMQELSAAAACGVISAAPVFFFRLFPASPFCRRRKRILLAPLPAREGTGFFLERFRKRGRAIIPLASSHSSVTILVTDPLLPLSLGDLNAVHSLQRWSEHVVSNTTTYALS